MAGPRPEHRIEAASAVIGAGAAGFMAAIFAARGGAAPLVLESRPRPGKKILISGGGRCNVLPSALGSSDFWTEGSPRSVERLLQTWPLEEVRAFFERELGVALEREASGKLFPRTNRARDVLEALLEECSRAGARLECGFEVTSLHPSDRGFELAARDGRRLRAGRVVLATGGLSVPSTGSDGFGLRIARELGHELSPPRPALVPLLAEPGPWLDLAGVALSVRLRALRSGRLLEERKGDFLFTHRGFSGPVVLDLSHHVTSVPPAELRVSWGRTEAGWWERRLREGGAGTLEGALRAELPRRLAALVLALAGVAPETRLAELGRAARRRLVGALEDWPLPVRGSEGYRKAEVTGGGVRLAEVRTSTLESRRVPGLHLCGEVLDVTGRIGGYNFLWAWVSGRVAGRALAAEPPCRPVAPPSA